MVGRVCVNFTSGIEVRMDERAKEVALKAELRAQGDGDAPVVPIERFFDGNDDTGSIGCNLLDHPGIPIFRDTLLALTRRPDVEAVYARIAELDPGEGLWPFSDTVLVVGTVALKDLRDLLAVLQPDEVADGDDQLVPEVVRRAHPGRVAYAWWD